LKNSALWDFDFILAVDQIPLPTAGAAKNCAEAEPNYQKIRLIMQPSGGRALLAEFAVSSEAHQ
jgi:hypothetical protein